MTEAPADCAFASCAGRPRLDSTGCVTGLVGCNRVDGRRDGGRGGCLCRPVGSRPADAPGPGWAIDRERLGRGTQPADSLVKQRGLLGAGRPVAQGKGYADRCRILRWAGRTGEGSTAGDGLLSQALHELPVLVCACWLLEAAKSGAADVRYYLYEGAHVGELPWDALTPVFLRPHSLVCPSGSFW